jgi:hypothetical protein
MIGAHPMPTSSTRLSSTGIPLDWAGQTALCEYYALCVNLAAGAVAHPILGLVPTCERCRAKHNLRFVTVEEVTP